VFGFYWLLIPVQVIAWKDLSPEKIYYVSREMLNSTHSLATAACRISLRGKGNTLYLVLCSSVKVVVQCIRAVMNGYVGGCHHKLPRRRGGDVATEGYADTGRFGISRVHDSVGRHWNAGSVHIARGS